MSEDTAQLSVSSESSNADEAEWLDVDSDEETVVILSLLDSERFKSVADMLAHCKQKYDFDFVSIVRRLQLDFHGAVKLVNFIRGQVSQKQPLPHEISTADFSDDVYLKPVLADDAFIFSLDDILETEQDSTAIERSSDDIIARNKDLEAELEAVRSQFANYRLAVEETLDRRWGDEKESTSTKPDRKSDQPDYYFESYAQHGVCLSLTLTLACG